MKKLILFLAIILTISSAFGQEYKELEQSSSIDKVTVFILGAQIHRTATVEIPKGKSQLVFTGLSPYIDAQSIQVSSDADFTIISVNHRQDFLEDKAFEEKVTSILDRLEVIEDSTEWIKAWEKVLVKEQGFLEKNQSIGGNNDGIRLEELASISTYYSDRMKSLLEKAIVYKRKLAIYEEEKALLEKQLQQVRVDISNVFGEVLVKVEAKEPIRAEVDFSYVADHAGWFPTYDVRVTDVSKPVELTVKANVRQSTGEEWEKVKLTLSNANPNRSGQIPNLPTYQLSFNQRVKQNAGYPGNPYGTLSGTVTDADGEPLIGASVLMKGSTVGTVTDLDGTYTISIPEGTQQMVISYTGYTTQEIFIGSSPVIDVVLEEGVLLETAVVIAQGVRRKGLGSQLSKLGPKKKDKKTAPPTTILENQTTVEYELDIPYTIQSDGEIYNLELASYDVPAYYEYQVVPKMDPDAFLIARIHDWDEYNLLEGEASLFFEGTYLGKSLLDVKYLSDTLDLSLGRDRNVLVQRKMQKEYSKKRFLGNKRLDTRSFKIVVRNNKKETINLMVTDQIPVSQQSEIEVNVEQLSGGILDESDGKVRWKLQLQAGQQKELTLTYSVKYPKNKRLLLE